MFIHSNYSVVLYMNETVLSRNNSDSNDISKMIIAENKLVCSDCKNGEMDLKEVRDDWRKKRTYYEQL
jgi:hypothetical protein